MGGTAQWLAVAILWPLEATGMPQNSLHPVGWTGDQVGLGIPAVWDTSLSFGSDGSLV